MPLDEKMVEEAAARSDAAVIVIGRTAGEDRDASAEKGSYLLTDLEEDMLEKVCRLFKKSIVVLMSRNQKFLLSSMHLRCYIQKDQVNLKLLPALYTLECIT